MTHALVSTLQMKNQRFNLLKQRRSNNNYYIHIAFSIIKFIYSCSEKNNIYRIYKKNIQTRLGVDL